MRLGGVDALAQEDELLRPGRPDRPNEAVCPSRARQDPDLHLGEPEHGGFVGHAKVRGEGELEPAAEAVPVDRADARLRERRDPLVDFAGLAVVGHHAGRVGVAHLADVGSRGERAAAPRDDERAGARDGVASDRCIQLPLQVGRERVQLRRPVQRHHADRVHEPHADQPAHARECTLRAWSPSRASASPR